MAFESRLAKRPVGPGLDSKSCSAKAPGAAKYRQDSSNGSASAASGIVIRRVETAVSSPAWFAQRIEPARTP